jgi:hypothetical protein
MLRKFRNFASIKIFIGALVAQSVERVLGKDEVGSSNLLEGSINNQYNFNNQKSVQAPIKRINPI